MFRFSLKSSIPPDGTPPFNNKVPPPPFLSSLSLPAVPKGTDSRLINQTGPMLSYSWAPRAQIFRRDANKVSTLDDFKNILRYNNWKNDPLSYGDPGNQVYRSFLTLINQGQFSLDLKRFLLVSILNRLWPTEGPRVASTARLLQ